MAHVARSACNVLRKVRKHLIRLPPPYWTRVVHKVLDLVSIAEDILSPIEGGMEPTLKNGPPLLTHPSTDENENMGIILHLC
jgi:hypothetical protein